MKKTLISVIALTSLVTASLVALKCRLKPPKKEVFNFVEPLKEEEQEVLDENEEADFFSKKAKMILSNKEEVKLLSFMIRQVRRFKRHGYPFVMFYNHKSKFFRKQQQAYEYLVDHMDEIKQSHNVFGVVVTKTKITIYFERN